MATINIDHLLTSADKDIERSVLAKVLIAKKMHPDLKEEYFSGAERLLYLDALSQWNQHGTIDSIVLKTKHHETIHEVMQHQSTFSKEALKILDKHCMRRQIGEMVLNIKGAENPYITIAEIQTAAARISLKDNEGNYDQAKQISELLEEIEKGYKGQLELLGFSSGLKEFDRYSGGFERGKLYLIGALKKTGKTKLAVHLSLQAMNQKAGVLWESLEMQPRELNRCALSNLAAVNSSQIGKKISDAEYNKIILMSGNLSELPWDIYRDKTVEQIRTRVQFLKAKKPVDILIIDYLQRMHSLERYQKRSDEIEARAMGIADMARELNVAVILFSQFSGAAEDLEDNQMPDMRHFKESQGPCEAADTIITMHNFDRMKNPYKEDGSYRLQDMWFLIAQRYDVSGVQFRVLGDLRYCHFKNHYDPYNKG